MTPNSPKAVAEALCSINVSRSYASQLSNGQRKPSQKLAIRIFRETGMKLGPIQDATDDQIETLAAIIGA